MKEDQKTYVRLDVKTEYLVSETPDEILFLIRTAEGKK